MDNVWVLLIVIFILAIVCRPILKRGLQYGISVANRIKWIGLFLLIVVILPSIPLMKKGFDQYKENRLEKMEHLNWIMTYTLGVSGDYEVYYNKVKWDDNQQINEVKAIINIYYYNYFNNEDFEYGELVDQYEKFCSGSLWGYEDLEEYAEFVYEREYIKCSELSPDNFSVKMFRDWCLRNIPQNKDLTEEQIIEVCDAVMNHKDIVYKSDIVMSLDGIVIQFNHKYPFYLTEEDAKYYFPVAFTDSYEYEELDNGEKVIKQGDIVYYLKDRVANMVTEEQGLYIYKVEINGNDEKVYAYSGTKIGDSMEDTIEGLEERFFVSQWDFVLESDTDNKKVYLRDGIKITVNGADGICTGIIVEMLD